MKKLRLFFITLLFLLVSQVYAFDGITYYGAEISNNDRYNSYGDRLTTVRDILRQDRANYYAYGLVDRYDQGDGYFANKSHRELFETARIIISPGLAHRIVYSSRPVLITVYVISPDRIEVRAGLD